MNSLNGIVKGCAANIGGIRRIFFAIAEVDSITITNYVVTAMTLDAGSPQTNQFVEWQVRPNTASYSINGTIDAVGVTEWEHALTISVNIREATKNLEMNEIIYGKKKWIALVQTADNKWWLLGWSRGLTTTQINGGSGTNKADGSNYEVTLSGIQKDLELQVEESVALSLI